MEEVDIKFYLLLVFIVGIFLGTMLGSSAYKGVFYRCQDSGIDLNTCIKANFDKE